MRREQARTVLRRIVVHQHQMTGRRLRIAISRQFAIHRKAGFDVAAIDQRRGPDLRGKTLRAQPERMFAPTQGGRGAAQRVQVRGLMTMAALSENPEDARPTFRALRTLRDQLDPRAIAPHTLEHLSMGMSQDFEVAIEEGATMVRLGTVLFEGIGGSAA